VTEHRKKKKRPPNPLPCGCVVVKHCPLHAAANVMLVLLIEAEHDLRQRARPDAAWMTKCREIIKATQEQPNG